MYKKLKLAERMLDVMSFQYLKNHEVFAKFAAANVFGRYFKYYPEHKAVYVFEKGNSDFTAVKENEYLVYNKEADEFYVFTEPMYKNLFKGLQFTHVDFSCLVPKEKESEVIQIIAVSTNDAVGTVDGNGNFGMPWGMTLKEDMKFFRKQTTGNIVLMGTNTFKSLGMKPLPKRLNIVVGTSFGINDIRELEGEYNNLIIFNDFDEAMTASREMSIVNGVDLYIMGGISIYRQAAPYIDKLYMTMVMKDYDNIVEGNENDGMSFKNELMYQYYNPFTDLKRMDFLAHNTISSHVNEKNVEYRILEFTLNK